MKHVRVSALVMIVVGALLSSGSRIGAQQPPDQVVASISPEALAQINALIAEKDTRSAAQRKVDSQLLYESRMESGVPLADGIWALATDLPYAADGHVIVDVQAQAGSSLAARWQAAGVEVIVVSAGGASLRAHVNIADVEGLAADPDVLFIQPRQDSMVTGQDAIANLVAPTGQGSVSSEGDVTHLAFAARGAFHIDGTGMKIGVLSNGVANLAASQARGDLGPVTVLPGQAGTGDEGTAMLEIVHDLAPGAQLFFATANSGITSFAQNIRDLRTAGCDIIVDDVFYFVETPFEDGQPAPTNTNGGAVIQAVNDVTAAGALYFSSAGNSGNLDAGTSGTWEGDFADGGATASPIPTGNRVHLFNATQAFNVITAATTNPTNLYWSDPLGGAANDYDLFRLDSTGATVLASSTNIQSGTQDPYEQTTCGGTACAAGQRLVVVKKTASASRFLHLGTNRGRLQIATAGETHGHAAAADAYDVAATPAVGPFPQAFNAGNMVETFSSDGPRRVFFKADGSAYTPGDSSATGGLLRQKPDITAADGVSVTGVGGFGSPFFGTSAAAPHAAAIAGLLKSAAPALTAAQVRSILTSTAIDIQAPGVDRDSGAGIIMARGALMASGAPGTAFLAVDSVQASDNPGNGNGVPEAGEGAKLLVTLKNYGVAPATAISGALTTSSVGITIAQPSTETFPDLAPLASATGAPLLFTSASDFGCPGAANFTFTANYSGSAGPLAQPFSIPIGITGFTVTHALGAAAPVVTPGVTFGSGAQTGRLFRDGVVAACGTQKVINSANPVVDALQRQYESYTVNTCGNSSPSCATVTLQGANAINLFTAAYAPSFNPASILQNYKADPGSSAAARTYSFDVPGGAQTFAVDVHDVPVSATPSGNVYTLSVSGICTGTCQPPNHPPVAKAKNVTVPAGPACTADASIDNGSSDPDGDPLTFAQAPPSPYALGLTPVVLTVTDPSGAFSQASGNVTVVDTTGPSITAPSMSPSSLWPPNHKMVDVTVSYGASDNCGAASCVLTVSSNDDGSSADWTVVDNHHVQLRAERSGGAKSGRIYTITVTCTDTNGNKSVRTGTVLVPHNQ